MSNTKYDHEKYIECGFYGPDEDFENKTEKIVKCRKPHTCMGCQSEIKAGDYALCESGFLDGRPVSCYTCISCLDSWLEESGQVDTEEECEHYENSGNSET